VIVSPESGDFPYSTYSYDLFSSAGTALGPYFSDDVEFPENFGANIADNSAGPRRAGLYRIVAAATMQEE
jgi:hypothetical protein